MKRKVQHSPVTRKLRSTLPRRRRSEIYPIIISGKVQTTVSSSPLSLLTPNREASTRVSCNSPAKSSDSVRRVVTRLYSKRRENQERENESSCIESSSVIEKRGNEEREVSTAAISDSSCVESSFNKQNELSTAEFPLKIVIPSVSESSCAESTVKQNELEVSTADHFPVKTEDCSDLVCSELLLCDEDQSDYSSAFSDLESDVFCRSSLDYTPSVWLDSESEFSERSVGDDSTPSPTFSLFLQFAQEFCPSAFSPGEKSVSEVVDEHRVVPMEDEEDEESYTMLRSRERREVYMHDYAEEYCSETDFGHLVIQQRLEIVHWIVEEATAKELHKETLFLGVSLLDRFLSKGFFKNKRNLQVAGIACLALATRIEENQPFNSVRKKIISVGSDTYSRCEVVAMEWLVQEVLNFKCFMPTIYNFLWFYLKAAKANENVEETAKYLAVLALLGHEQLCFWPSTVAAGLVILASLSANGDGSCNRVVETHVRTKEDDLSDCLKSLEWLVKYAC